MAGRGHAAVLQLRNQAHPKHTKLTGQLQLPGARASARVTLGAAGTAGLPRQRQHALQIGRTHIHTQDHLLLPALELQGGCPADL